MLRSYFEAGWLFIMCLFERCCVASVVAGFLVLGAMVWMV
jgi:hypothetical protein